MEEVGEGMLMTPCGFHPHHVCPPAKLYWVKRVATNCWTREPGCRGYASVTGTIFLKKKFLLKCISLLYRKHENVHRTGLLLQTKMTKQVEKCFTRARGKKMLQHFLRGRNGCKMTKLKPTSLEVH